MVLDVLRLVADHPGPVHLAERGLVPGGHAVGGDDQVRPGQSGSERVAVQPVRAVVHVHAQVRGEPRRLALPVADQRHRAHQQGRVGAGRLRRDERQQLDRLAQAHVVGQDAAEAELAEEGQPGQPALLVGPQLAGEAGRGRHRPQPVVGLAGQQIAQPAVGVHPDQRDLLVGFARAQAQPGRQRVRRGHRPGLVALQELQRRLQVRVVQLDPLAAQPDQRDLQPGQLGQLVRIERLVAHGHVVTEVHQVTQAEPGHGRPGGRRAGRGPGPRGQLQPEPGLAHPVRQQHAEPGRRPAAARSP